MLALPHEDTDWNYILDEVCDWYLEFARLLMSHGNHVVMIGEDEPGIVSDWMGPSPSPLFHYIPMKINDTWIRDYGPLTVEEDGRLKALDFGFNGWGLKFPSCHDNMAMANLASIGLFKKYENHRGFILEGGSVESDGEGTLLTTENCLLSPNRNPSMTKKEITAALKDTLGCKKVLWLRVPPLAGDDTDSHIDTLARLAPDDTIVYTACDDLSDDHYPELADMEEQIKAFRTLKRKPFRLIPLPFPDAIYDPDDGHRLPATYSNYLVCNDYVYVPNYNQPEKDRKAMEQISLAFPGKNIVGVDCRVLIRQHGSLHCATMQIPEALLNRKREYIL